jgi:hypothetical protein
MSDLTELWYEASQGKMLTPESIERAKGELDSPLLYTKVMANSILFFAGAPGERDAAIRRLKDLCQELDRHATSEAVAILMLALERWRDLERPENRCFVDMAYTAARGSFVGARINAVRVLGRLARKGDKLALEVLKQARNDPESLVQRGAEAALRMVG